MSPRFNDTNASSTKQKKKNNDSAPSPSVIAASVKDPTSPTSSTVTDLSAPPSFVSVPGVKQEAHFSALASGSGASVPRSFVASTLKPVSGIETVTSTISSLSHHANRGISNLLAAHSTNPASPQVAPVTVQPTAARIDGAVSPIYDAFHNAGTVPNPAHIDAALHSAQTPDQAPCPPLPRVLWSRWDRLALSSPPLRSAPLLISYFDNGTLQALLVDDRNITEVLSLPNAADVLLDRPAISSVGRSQLLTALVRPPAADTTDSQLLMVVQEPDNTTSLLTYSLTTHQVQMSVHLQHHFQPVSAPHDDLENRQDILWPRVQAQCNERYLVLSFAAPASIHVLSHSALEYVIPPMLDVSAAFPERPPAFSLSHRLLAFSCTASKEVSAIRSDQRSVSVSAYHDPLRPSAYTHADAAGRVGEMRDNLFETSAHVGDAARRIRGGVMTGVRTLGEWGSSYWPHAGSPPAPPAFSPPQPSLLSQSAPHTAAQSSRRTSSASSSPMLLAADGDLNVRRLSPGVSAVMDAAGGSGQSVTTARAACVRVIDLGSNARTICTFAPSNHATALASFSPCGRMLLTADTLGHAFHVFEMPVLGSFGSSFSPSSSPAVAHRYKLMRGITTSNAVHAEWSTDAQWVAVGTHSGTVHIYAVNPFGGIPSIANHIQGKVKNPHTLQPFGLSLASLARSVRPSAPPQQETLLWAAGPSKLDGAAFTTTGRVKTALPSFLLLNQGARSRRFDGDSSSPFELLTRDARSTSVTLHAVRCWSTQTEAPNAGNGTEHVHITSSDPHRRFVAATSSRSSGLSQMMRKAGEGLLQTQQPARLQAECVRVALWDQLLPEGDSISKHIVTALGDSMGASRSASPPQTATTKPFASVAKAEIETYSQSPAMLPSSIFLSRQTFFHARTRTSNKVVTSLTGTEEPLRCIQRRGSRPILVRRTARLVSREPSSETASSFDDSLAGALDLMSFDPEHLPPRSASAHIPSFPQGHRGRSAGWTAGSSIPIRIVSSGLGGIYRAGKELGRGVEMARRRGPSTAAASDGTVSQETKTAASISLEGEDDEMDLLGEDADRTRSERNRYSQSNGTLGQIGRGSARSDLSLLSALDNDARARGSQPSSAETPSTRFSEAEDPSGDADECDWDTIEASRSPAAPVASLLDMAETDSDMSGKNVALQGTRAADPGTNSVDDDFTVGMFEEDSGDAAVLRPQTTLSSPQELSNKMGTARRDLVYALPSGGSTRSSLLSQSSGLTTMADHRSEAKASPSSPRDGSPTNSDGGDSGSAGSGLLCEGSKVTQTIDSSLAAAAETNAADKDGIKISIDPIGAATPVSISTSGGGPKKKKKKGGR